MVRIVVFTALYLAALSFIGLMAMEAPLVGVQTEIPRLLR
jgi:hypothetical protein